MSFGPCPDLRHLADVPAKALIVRLREAVAPILANNLLPHFTDHTVAHSDRLTDIVDQLIMPVQASVHALNADELVVLYSSCYLHDLGMQCEAVGHTNTIASLNLAAPWNQLDEGTRRGWLRETHHAISAELVTGSVHSSVPPIGIQLTSDYHPSAIACICEAHGVDTASTQYKTLVVPHPRLRLPLLSALLRVGDILEESRRRALREKARTLELDNEAEVHWWRHYYTEDIVFDQQRRRIIIWFDFPPDRLTEYKDVVPALQVPEVRQELARHNEVFAEVSLSWTLEVNITTKQHSDTEPMPEEVFCAMLKKYHRQQLLESERTRALLVGTFSAARPYFERRFQQLSERTHSKQEYLAELQRLANDMWEIGAKRSAWMLLHGPYERDHACLSPQIQVEMGIILARMMREDGESKWAARTLCALAPLVGDQITGRELRFRYYELLSGCLIEVCDYLEAQKIISQAIQYAPTPDAQGRLEAELAELHLLQGEVLQAIQVIEPQKVTK